MYTQSYSRDFSDQIRCYRPTVSVQSVIFTRFKQSILVDLKHHLPFP